MTDIETRPLAEPVEVRTHEDGRRILTGVAIRYGARSRDLGGFRERIMPGAATEAIQKGDVHAYEEHRSHRYLGRTGNDTLRLVDSATELRYEVDLPNTSVGNEVAALAERSDYKGSSFGFRANPTVVEWTKGDDGLALRTVRGFRLLRDVGPTVAPAYDDTAAVLTLRSFAAETGIEVEERSVLDLAAAGELASLLDPEHTIEPTTPPVIRRASWFV